MEEFAGYLFLIIAAIWLISVIFQFILDHLLEFVIVGVTIVSIILLIGYFDRKKKDDEERNRLEKEQKELQDQENRQRMISETQQRIKELNGYQIDVIPFMKMLDREGENIGFSEITAKCSRSEKYISRVVDQINREADNLGIPERSKVFYR